MSEEEEKLISSIEDSTEEDDEKDLKRKPDFVTQKANVPFLFFFTFNFPFHFLVFFLRLLMIVQKSSQWHMTMI